MPSSAPTSQCGTPLVLGVGAGLGRPAAHRRGCPRARPRRGHPAAGRFGQHSNRRRRTSAGRHRPRRRATFSSSATWRLSSVSAAAVASSAILRAWPTWRESSLTWPAARRAGPTASRARASASRQRVDLRRVDTPPGQGRLDRVGVVPDLPDVDHGAPNGSLAAVPAHPRRRVPRPGRPLRRPHRRRPPVVLGESAARCSPSSGPTAPARPRPSRPSRGTAGRVGVGAACSASTRRRPRRLGGPHRRDAPARRRLPGPRPPARAAPVRPLLRRPRGPRRPARARRARARSPPRRGAGCRAGSSSGCRWPWPSSAGPRSSSSTSRPPESTPRAGWPSARIIASCGTGACACCSPPTSSPRPSAWPTRWSSSPGAGGGPGHGGRAVGAPAGDAGIRFTRPGRARPGRRSPAALGVDADGR